MALSQTKVYLVKVYAISNISYQIKSTKIEKQIFIVHDFVSNLGCDEKISPYLSVIIFHADSVCFFLFFCFHYFAEWSHSFHFAFSVIFPFDSSFFQISLTFDESESVHPFFSLSIWKAAFHFLFSSDVTRLSTHYFLINLFYYLCSYLSS